MFSPGLTGQIRESHKDAPLEVVMHEKNSSLIPHDIVHDIAKEHC